MAKKNLRKRAQRDTELRYGSELSALAQLLKDAGTTYGGDVASAHAGAQAQVQGAQAARPDIVNAYLQAAKIGDAAQADTAPVISQIDPQGPAATIMAGIGREREQSGSALGGALANALGGLTDRESQARAGEALNVRQAQQERNKTTSAANQKILDVKNEAGTYAVSRLDEYRDARQAAALTRRGQNVTTAGQTSTALTATKNRKAENTRAKNKIKADADKAEKDRQADLDKALIDQGLDPSSGTKDPKTGKTTYKPLPGAKSGGKKDQGMLPPASAQKVVARVRTVANHLPKLMSAPDADQSEIEAGLAAGDVDGTRYTAPEIKVAFDMWRNNGKLSPGGAKYARRQLRVSVPGFFTTSPGKKAIPWAWGNPITGTVPGG